MPNDVFTIYLVSNVSREALKIAAGLERVNRSGGKVNKTMALQAGIVGSALLSWAKLKTEVTKTGAATELTNKELIANILITKIFNRENKTAGLNIGMLSLRIHEWLVPVLGIAYTAMLPVIAGLVTIAAAAGAAGIALAGVGALGAFRWSRDFTGGLKPVQMNANWAFAGENDFSDVVFKGIIDALDNPSIRGKMDRAADWVEQIFKYTIPSALIGFVRGIDMGVMKHIVDIFNKWLPDVMERMSTWGSELIKIYGSRSLKLISKGISSLARSLLDFALWMKTEGEEDIIDFFGRIIEFLGGLFKLGMAVLPVMNQMLAEIWPMPLKPILQTLTAFFETLENYPVVGKTVMLFTQYLVGLVAIKAIIGTIGAFLGYLFELIESFANIFDRTGIKGKVIKIVNWLRQFQTVGAITTAIKTFASWLSAFIVNAVIGAIVGAIVLWAAEVKYGILTKISDLGEPFREFIDQLGALKTVLQLIMYPLLAIGNIMLWIIGLLPGVDTFDSSELKRRLMFGEFASFEDDLRSVSSGDIYRNIQQAILDVNVRFDDNGNWEAFVERELGNHTVNKNEHRNPMLRRLPS
jgi:hypothetical protein